MSGIYYHIPFCKQACHYCNFHFSTSLAYKDEMIEAMINEIKIVADSSFLPTNENIQTIYFGGGTPSLLNADDIKKLLNAAYQNYKIEPNAEITLEANPDDISESKLSKWRSVGINRLSLGVQSFSNADLLWMNRAHNAVQARDSIHLIKDAGFNNFSVDLIYGTPGLPDEDSKSIGLKKNVQTLIDLNVPHISCYALTVEPNTALHKMISLKKKDDVNPDTAATQFLLLMNWLTAAGYDHYEISNFAKPGFSSKHNSSYWQRKSYIGIGPSAHSFNGNKRRWNVSNNMQYIQSLQNNIIPFEEEELSDIQKLNEYIMTALRTKEGVDLDFIKENFGNSFTQKLQGDTKKFIEMGHLYNERGKLIVTNPGKLFADGIASALFF